VAFAAAHAAGRPHRALPQKPKLESLNLGCIKCQSEPKHERRLAMTEIKWEKDFHKAVELAGKTNKALFQDFWFDG
jgi:hypothetical protein